jgi:CLIP-associating protein 1/2
MLNQRYGAHSLPICKILTSVVKLLSSDSNQMVRDKSLNTILEMYKHVGEKLRGELRKKQMPEAK